MGVGLGVRVRVNVQVRVRVRVSVGVGVREVVERLGVVVRVGPASRVSDGVLF